MMKSFLIFLVLLTPWSLSAIDSVVTFNELQYHPPGSDQSGEWIELGSEMAVDVDLSGWEISGGIDFVFPEGTIIEGGGQVVVARDPANPALSAVDVLGPFAGQLANGGETLTLRDQAGRLMDTMSYRDRGDWTVMPDGSGVTLAKKGRGLRSSRSISWTHSEQQGGTPGAENFPDPPLFEEVESPVLNEVAPGGSADFFVELANPSTESVDLGGLFLVIVREARTIVPLPSIELAPGGFFSLTAAELGLLPQEGDRLYLGSGGLRAPLEARRVTGRLRGRAPGQGAAWLYPREATPGEANLIDLEEDIIINEICYNPPRSNALSALPPTFETVAVVARDALWLYNESGDDLGSEWADRSYAVGGDWKSGDGPLGFARGLDFSLGTVLTRPDLNSPPVVTYYFESEFELSEAQAEGVREIVLDHAVDDGAIFYFNGLEVERFNLPEGPVSADTLASEAVGDAEFRGPLAFAVPRGLAVAGTNRISVEVHQNAVGSRDVAFGLEAALTIQVDAGRPRQPAESSDNQWVELYNRGTDEVDLSGWDFGEGIDFEFPPGIVLGANEYLVVAREPGKLAASHPQARILGPFGRALSRGGETLILRDAWKNPADSLRYYDGGRWPGLADARGSTMELTDPRADNSLPTAWAASDEVARTTWETFTYRGVAERSRVGPDSQWRDFVFGLLEEGEILIDDLALTEDPDGAARPLLVDGTFENGNADSWRFLGSHREAEIVPDPDGGGHVLRLRATNSTGHMHNHVETTLANGESVVNGVEYELSFRARWLNGDNQLHTRLYFNRLPRKTLLARPEILGTLGAPNSTRVANLGPTGHSLAHRPVVPGPGEPVTVTVSLRDPDGLGSVRLFFNRNGSFFSSLPMSPTGEPEEWAATIPGATSGDVVQFYVEASDAAGVISLTPAGGAESRALYQVDDGRAATTGINNIRIIMDPDDRADLYDPPKVMSNGRLGCTVIDREEQVYYNAGVRIKGSQRARLASQRIGFNLGFPRDQLYRGVHRTIAIDRSEGQNVGQRESLFDLMATSSGGIPGEHNDLCYVIAPDPRHTSAAALQMARYGSEFLGSQFENGSEGTVYEYELIYYPLRTNSEGFKLPQPDSVVGTRVTSLGDDPENYRWIYLIKNNQENDNFDPMMRMTSLFDLPRDEFHEQVDEVLDVDQWLRSLAYSCAMGAGDSYFSNSRHNGQFYARPDGRILCFPHDNDFLFQTNRPIFQNSELTKLISDPAKRRRYLGHLEDICGSVYNREWMSRWTAHFDELVPGSPVFGDDLSYIGQRSSYILGQVAAQVSQVAFSIETNNGDDFRTTESPVILSGKGWVDIDEIRLAGSDRPLPVTWTDEDEWEIPLAVVPGVNSFLLEAYDFAGGLVGSDAITVTSTASSTVPSVDNLVVSEIFYNPDGADEGTEYLEFLNISPVARVDLSGMQITDGVDFVFPGGVVLEPGERTLVVADRLAFEARFGGGLPIAGAFANQLANGGETLTIRRADGALVRSFSYSDDPPWPGLADGDDFTLVLVAPRSAPDHSLALNWRAGAVAGGSPARDDRLDYQAWKAEFGDLDDGDDPDGDGWTVLQEFILGGSPLTRDELAPGHRFDAGPGLLTSTVNLRVGAGTAVTFQSSDDLVGWNPADEATYLGSERLVIDGVAVDQLRFASPLGRGGRYYRFFFEQGE